MKTRYSPSTGSFYPFDVDYQSVPTDVIEVPLETFHSAMNRPAGHSFTIDAHGALTIIAPPAPSLEDLKAAKLLQLNRESQALANSLTAGYPEFEKLTWEDQRREAIAWAADNNTATPYIDGLAAERGIDRVDYLQRTLARTTAFLAASQKLVGQRQRYEDQIKAAQTPEDLAAIVFVFNLS